MPRFAQIATACALGFSSFVHCGSDKQLRGSAHGNLTLLQNSPVAVTTIFAPTRDGDQLVQSVPDTMATSQNKGYRPIFYMHGIRDVARSGDALGTLIQRKHPGTKWIPIPLFEGDVDSLQPMKHQVKTVHDWIKDYVEGSPSDFVQGFNLVCHSQGALVCRGVLTIYGDLDAKTFVSLAGPQMGVGSYDDWDAPKWALTYLISGGIYTATAQKHVSFASYYKDMTQYGKYQEESLFLARINNEYPESPTCYKKNLQCKPAGCYSRSGPAWRDEQCHYGYDAHDEARYNQNSAYKVNFQRLEKAIFVGSSGDGMIVPWVSTIWGYSKMSTNVNEHKYDTDYRRTIVWTKDLVPLQAMDREGKLLIDGTLENVAHNDWLKVKSGSNVGLHIYLPHLK